MDFVSTITKQVDQTNQTDSTYQINPIDNLSQIISTNTWGLDKFINFEDSNIIFSGGLLFECIRKPNDKFDTNSLFDIDLFLFGNKDNKISTYNKIIKNLSDAGLEIILGFNRSVVYIFVKDIPRIIQLVFTDFDTPEQIIDSFDFVHLQSYWNGSNLYTKSNAFTHIENLTTDINYRPCINRYIKYDLRGINLDNILYQEYDFVFGDKQYYGFINRFSQNLENIQKLFENNSDKQIDEMKKILTDNFKLALLDNLETQVDLFGKFTNYTNDNIIEDDVVKPRINNIHLFKSYNFEYQKYIYTKCKVLSCAKLFPKSHNYRTVIEINNLRVINYLFGLEDEIKHYLEDIPDNDFIKFVNNNANLIKYHNPFSNSLGYEIDKKGWVEQVGGLVVKIYHHKLLEPGKDYRLILSPTIYINSSLKGFNLKIHHVIE